MGERDEADSLIEDGDEVCSGYRDCLLCIESGDFERAAALIATIWPLDPRYAMALEDKLEVTRRWQSVQGDEAAKERFWQWMDSRH